jgi:DNA-binding GntR family transcriptional regulator
VSWRSGSRLENEIDLADRLGLSRPTMRKAIGYLVDRGLLVRKRGVGHPGRARQGPPQVELTSLYDDLAKTRRDPSTTVVSFSRLPASGRVALDLGLAEGTEVYAFERLRCADGEPLALMRNHVPAGLLPLTAEAWNGRACTTCSGRPASRCASPSSRSAARAATAAEARALGESKAAPLLTMERTAYDDRGRAVEHGSHSYRASRYSFDSDPDRLVTGGLAMPLRA